jgi:hypothetical protein
MWHTLCYKKNRFHHYEMQYNEIKLQMIAFQQNLMMCPEKWEEENATVWCWLLHHSEKGRWTVR